VDANMKRIIIGVAGAAAAFAFLAGCSSNNSPTAASTSTTTTVKSTTGTTGPHGPATSIPGATTIPYNPALNARTDVTTLGCTPVLGAWELKGTVKNSAAKTRSYQIVVDWITQPGDTVLDTKIVTVSNVAPGASEPWNATGAAGQKNLACVVRQVQAQ
jgi:hypothetical protein